MITHASMVDVPSQRAYQSTECPAGEADRDTIVSRSKLLTLSPPSLEQEFWTQRALYAIDAFAVVHALVMNMMLFKTFKVLSTDHMLPHERAAVVLYPLLALWHIYYMGRRPQQYNKHRLSIMLVHRIGRLLLLLLTAVLSTPVTVHNMAVALPGWQGFVHEAMAPQQAASKAVAAAEGTLLVDVASAGEAAAAGDLLGQQQQDHDLVQAYSLMQLVKPICGPVLVALGYSHFIIPLRLNISLQLATFAVALAIVRVRVCWFLTRHGMQQLICYGCNAVANVVYGAGIFFGWPWNGVQPSDATCDDPLLATLVMTLFSHTVLLIIAPLLAQYVLELALKGHFVQCKGMRLHQTLSDCTSVVVVVGLSAPIGAWLLCGAVVNAMPRFTCNPQGFLVT